MHERVFDSELLSANLLIFDLWTLVSEYVASLSF